jgi:WhiB family redox-sensing transcriptional regulator
VSTLPIDQFFTAEPWITGAKCAGLAGAVAAEIFFPSRGTSLAPARAICGTCPVREDCLDFALRTGQHHGVWGGYSERERRGMRRVRRVALGAPLARLPDLA